MSPRKTWTGPAGSLGYEVEFEEYERILEEIWKWKVSKRELYLIDAKWFKNWLDYVAGDWENPP